MKKSKSIQKNIQNFSLKVIDVLVKEIRKNQPLSPPDYANWREWAEKQVGEQDA